MVTVGVKGLSAVTATEIIMSTEFHSKILKLAHWWFFNQSFISHKNMIKSERNQAVQMAGIQPGSYIAELFQRVSLRVQCTRRVRRQCTHAPRAL